MSSNPAHGIMYSIQHYVIKFVSDLRLVGGFYLVSCTNKSDRHAIAELLLNVALKHKPTKPILISRLYRDKLAYQRGNLGQVNRADQ